MSISKLTVRVTRFDAIDAQVEDVYNATRWTVEDDYLNILDHYRNVIAMYPRGMWIKVEVD